MLNPSYKVGPCRVNLPLEKYKNFLFIPYKKITNFAIKGPKLAIITFNSLQRGCLSLFGDLIYEKHPHGELK